MSPFDVACRCCRGDRAIARRRFLAGSGGAALIAAAGARAAPAETYASPEAALERLMQGNARFVADALTSFDEDLAELRAKNLDGQAPFAAILSCADSRVPVELAFDESIGRIFVARVAGNICTPEIIASLEYGAAVLGTPVIMVLGHGGCGAVKACIAAKAVPGQISTLYAPIREAVSRAGPDLDATVKANAQVQANILRTASPVVAARIAEGKLKVVAAYFDLATGKVALLA